MDQSTQKRIDAMVARGYRDIDRFPNRSNKGSRKKAVLNDTHCSLVYRKGKFILAE
jgi:hypothetical protein